MVTVKTASMSNEGQVPNLVKNDCELVSTDVGVFPEDWELKPLGEIGQPLAGLTYAPADVSSEGTLVLRSSNVQGGKLAFKDNVYVRMDIPDRAIVREGDILICVRNGSRELIGKCALVDKKASGMAFGAFMGVFRSDINEFLFYALQCGYVQRQIREHLGATINQITAKSLKSFRIALPKSSNEISAVARSLTEVDQYVSDLESLVKKKRHVKQGAIQELLSGRRRLPGFSGEWNERSFGDLFTFLPTATNSRAELGPDGDVYYIHYGDIHTQFHSHLNFASDEPPRIVRDKCRRAAVLRNGDWIMADASEDTEGVGKAVEVCGLTGRDLAVSGLHTFLLREKTPTFVPGFKGHLGGAEFLRKQYLRVMTGMKVFGVSKTALRELVVPVPSPKEQEALVEVFDDIDADIASLQARLEKARQIKQGMMQDLLTGRVRLV